jgi:hypothetical protein
MTREEIRSEWEKTQLLKFVPEEVKIELAACLEGQKLENENTSEEDQWLRLSLPIIVKIFNNVRKLKGSHLPLSKNYVFTVKKNVIGTSFDEETKEFQRLADALSYELISLLDNKTLIIHNLNCTPDGTIFMNYDWE